MSVELRKIQVTGGSTHVISLPKKWVDRNGLQRSETLAIHEEPDGSLLVVPHQDARPRQRRVVLDVPDVVKEEDIVRRLVGAYLAGADEIHLRSKGRMDPKVRNITRNVIRDLVGVEILEEGSDSLTLQDLVGVSEMDLRKTVTRMHRIARIMFDDALAAVQEGNPTLAKDVSGRDDELDRLEWHVSKQMHALLEQPRLAARLQIRPAEALNLYMVARTIERMGDHASKICKNVPDLQDLPEDLLEDILTQADVVKNVWDEAFTALKRDDFDQGSAAVDEGKGAGPWRGAFSQRLQDLDPELVGPLTLVADSIDRVRSYAIDIAEVAMNQTFQKAAVAN
ncbi:MAG: PhoU domain-containing protein [Thermoplasmatota archaeon]